MDGENEDLAPVEIEQDEPQDQIEAGEESEAEESAEEESSEPESEDVEIAIDGELIHGDDDDEIKGAPQWVKAVRQENRRLARELKAAQAKLTAVPAQPVEDVPVGPKPRLEDFNYDSEAFEPALEKWVSQKAAADQKAQERQRQAEAQAQEWNARIAVYESGKKAMKLPDFDDAEDAIKEHMDQTQQGIIVHGTKDPALFVYAMGKSPKALKELAAIKDPVKFAMRVGELQTVIKMQKKKTAPAPETKPSGGGSVSPKTSQATLDRLKAEALKTGDRTKVVQYMKQQAKKA